MHRTRFRSHTLRTSTFYHFSGLAVDRKVARGRQLFMCHLCNVCVNVIRPAVFSTFHVLSVQFQRSSPGGGCLPLNIALSRSHLGLSNNFGPFHGSFKMVAVPALRKRASAGGPADRASRSRKLLRSICHQAFGETESPSLSGRVTFSCCSLPKT